jgi:hypothetical protein
MNQPRWNFFGTCYFLPAFTLALIDDIEIIAPAPEKPSGMPQALTAALADFALGTAAKKEAVAGAVHEVSELIRSRRARASAHLAGRRE